MDKAKQRMDLMCTMRKKTAQQEMVGFVLIVVLVVVGLLVFLVVMINTPKEEKSIDAENALEVIMRTTTDCAIVFEPEFQDYEDLFKSCYENRRCSNLNIDACDYLNSSISEVLEDIYKSESAMEGYELDFMTEDGDGILKIGGCAGASKSAQRSIIDGSEKLIARLKFCQN